MNIFAAVGTQKFQFNRLIDALDSICNNNIHIFIQYGNSKKPQLCKGSAFLKKEIYSEYIKQADLVIVHGGVGTIRSALSLQAKVIAVPRNSKYNEHVDNHQNEIVSAFAEHNYILPCYDLQELPLMISTALNHRFTKFIPAPCKIENYISEYFVKCGFKAFI